MIRFDEGDAPTEASRSFAAVLDQAEHGETIVVTRGGKHCRDMPRSCRTAAHGQGVSGQPRPRREQ
ncbi:hypothetical protein E1292_23880 [Nonomuraea deserti]|uniref:Type II toxin-antitoxin system prevent-host-death family antitoxin n=1 Tax=Nonomuraea deserti TaxID=1848322 RepID=A0A4R4VAC0_9ACTN|nr:hypothetical protein E1292_23880 [Nonomuraea deserti]